MVISTGEIESYIDLWLKDRIQKEGLPDFWRESLVGFLPANHPGIEGLKELVVSNHYQPEDFLEGAKSVVCFFLPFKAWVAKTNIKEEAASKTWADAYMTTNRLAIELGEDLLEFFKERGYRAAYPYEATIFPKENPRSRWSQRHLAYYAGLGSFGINNLLISSKGSLGRYFSIITDMEVEGAELSAEHCLYKQDGSCTICVDACSFGALNLEGFDRHRCLEQLGINEKLVGAGVCGKCAVGLPCSFGIPRAR